MFSIDVSSSYVFAWHLHILHETANSRTYSVCGLCKVLCLIYKAVCPEWVNGGVRKTERERERVNGGVRKTEREREREREREGERERLASFLLDGQCLRQNSERLLVASAKSVIRRRRIWLLACVVTWLSRWSGTAISFDRRHTDRSKGEKKRN